MPTMSSRERGVLERAVLAARATAEQAVTKRFAALDLPNGNAPAGMGADDRLLRTALRCRAADLGHGRVEPTLGFDAAVRASTPFLVEELAYEAWHRLLFARFLVENELLTDPELGMVLSLDDLTDLAAAEQTEPWELAARYAGARLPGLFHLATPLRLASEDRQDLARILTGMEAELFRTSDALGWTYQFWQAQRKDQINASGQKITGATLPAVTQLFTEDYIVDFLLQNSLGAWYVSHHAETHLREAWPYVRYREDGTPAAGTFVTWPDHIKDVTVLDPCCGSGHFLVAAFAMLVAMRQEAEGLTESEAADAVLQDNLFGLELDGRCTQIAGFAVALEAWKRGGHPETHRPQIACSGIPVAGQAEGWRTLAGGDANLAIALDSLYDQFREAGELGSLIDPKRAVRMGGSTRRQQPGLALAHDWGRVERLLHTALEREATDPAGRVFAEDDHALIGTIKAAQLLGRTYTLVATNVPYLSRGSHSDVLKAYADATYPEARNDLATLMLERCLAFVATGDDAQGHPTGPGTVAAVTPQNWLTQPRDRNFRQHLLDAVSFQLVANLGFKSFRTPMWDFNIGLTILSNTAPGPDQTFAGLDASAAPGPEAKAELLQTGELRVLGQPRQHANPDQRILLHENNMGAPLGHYAESIQGLATSDLDSFSRSFWELEKIDNKWELLHSPSDIDQEYGGRSLVLLWEEGKGRYYRHAMGLKKAGRLGGWKSGSAAWNKMGVSVANMGDMPKTLYTGEKFIHSVNVLIPKDATNLPATWAFCSSPAFHQAVRQIDSALKVTNATLVKVPFDLAHWQAVAAEQYPEGLPEPSSTDPTQWLFRGEVVVSDHPLQVALARLLGYRWPDQAEDGLDALADPDGIVCLPALYQERPAHLRLRDLLAHAYGEAWSEQVLRGLLVDVGATSLEAWLRSKTGFFAQHVKLFHHRPFLWQISDGRPDGFSAVVNAHRLDRATLDKLVYTYLGDWIGRQERAVAQGEAGAQGRLDAATTLRQKLVAIAQGEPPYDLYVRWKSLAEQPIGWEPDLDDGVRLNIRPFVEAGVLAAKVNVKWGKDRGADPAVRDEPLAALSDPELKQAIGEARISEFKRQVALHQSVERHNDLHFTTAEKRAARVLAKAGTGSVA